MQLDEDLHKYFCSPNRRSFDKADMGSDLIVRRDSVVAQCTCALNAEKAILMDVYHTVCYFVRSQVGSWMIVSQSITTSLHQVIEPHIPTDVWVWGRA